MPPLFQLEPARRTARRFISDVARDMGSALIPVVHVSPEKELCVNRECACGIYWPVESTIELSLGCFSQIGGKLALHELKHFLEHVKGYPVWENLELRYFERPTEIRAYSFSEQMEKFYKPLFDRISKEEGFR